MFALGPNLLECFARAQLARPAAFSTSVFRQNLPAWSIRPQARKTNPAPPNSETIAAPCRGVLPPDLGSFGKPLQSPFPAARLARAREESGILPVRSAGNIRNRPS